MVAVVPREVGHIANDEDLAPPLQVQRWGNADAPTLADGNVKCAGEVARAHPGRPHDGRRSESCSAGEANDSVLDRLDGLLQTELDPHLFEPAARVVTQRFWEGFEHAVAGVH
jgi:hypothetical protein